MGMAKVSKSSRVGGWTNPFEKYADRQIGSDFPKDRVENTKKNWKHQLRSFCLLVLYNCCFVRSDCWRLILVLGRRSEQLERKKLGTRHSQSFGKKNHVVKFRDDFSGWLYLLSADLLGDFGWVLARWFGGYLVSLVSVLSFILIRENSVQSLHRTYRV